MKKNLVPLLGIAFIVAIISTGIFYGLFVGRLKSATIAPGEAIVVAARNIDRGATLQPEDVKLAPWGSPEIPKGSFTEVTKVSGLTVTSPIQQNEPVLETRVASAGSGGAGLGIARGMRAVSIHAIDSSGVVSLLRPGYKVDVQLVSNQGTELRTILQNIEVLSVNPQGDGRGGGAPVITLLVTPLGADMAGLGDSTARLRVILRNPLDDGADELNSVSLPAILSRGAKK